VRHWSLAVSRAFLQAYCQNLEKSDLLPRDPEPLRTLLLAYLLNQAVDELGGELRRGSANVRAPLQGIIYLLEESLPVRAPAVPAATAAPAAQ
jgi:predicted trehalose synthase